MYHKYIKMLNFQEVLNILVAQDELQVIIEQVRLEITLFLIILPVMPIVKSSSISRSQQEIAPYMP